MTRNSFAHSLPGTPPEKWKYLKEHLVQVSCLARTFATKFNAGDWTYIAGLRHDLGKFPEEFLNLLLRYKIYTLPNFSYHPISTNLIEGANNKIKTMQRQTYGFRDDQFFKFRTRIMAIHNTKHDLVG